MQNRQYAEVYWSEFINLSFHFSTVLIDELCIGMQSNDQFIYYLIQALI